MVGEFKGWFSNLFNWKAQTHALQSQKGIAATRTEVRRLLAQCGVVVQQEEGTLRCRVDDGYDPITGALVQKHVRFRIEFGLPPPVQSHHSLTPLSPRRGSGGSGSGSGIAYACTVILVQEKGAMSTFRAVYQRLKEEWQFDSLQSPTTSHRSGPRSPESDVQRYMSV